MIHKYKVIGVIGTCMFVLFTLTACQPSTKNSSTPLNFTQQTPPPPAKEEPDISQYRKDKKEHKINKAHIYHKDDIVTQDGFEYGNIKFTVSKELPKGVHKDDITFYDDGVKADDKGNLLNATSYVFLTMDVTNNREQEETFGWNSTHIVALEDDYGINPVRSLTGWEARYRSGKENNLGKDYFMQNIKPGEKLTATIGYIVDDDWVHSKQLYFYFTPPGVIANDNRNIRAFQLNE